MSAKQPAPTSCQRGSTGLKAPFPVLTDLSASELTAADGGVGGYANDRLAVEDGSTLTWDDGWWFLDFKSTNR